MEKNVAADRQAAMEMVRVSGQQGVPVITIDGQVIVGFNQPRLMQLLKPKLGASIADAASQRKKHPGIPSSGAFVGRVRPGTAADKAGLKKGDVIVSLGGQQVLAHGKGDTGTNAIEILARDGEQLASLGVVAEGRPLTIGEASVALGTVRRYTGAQVYNRPQEPILVWGSVLMFAGLVWHFYFRHRDRRREGKSDA